MRRNTEPTEEDIEEAIASEQADLADQRPTLDDLRRQRYKTVKAFAAAWGVSVSTARLTLQGRRSCVMEQEEVRRLAQVLGTTERETIAALDGSAVVYGRAHGKTYSEDESDWRVAPLEVGTYWDKRDWDAVDRLDRLDKQVSASAEAAANPVDPAGDLGEGDAD